MGRKLRNIPSAPRTWKEAYTEFVFLLKARGYAPRTLREYQNHIPRFFQRYPSAWEGNLRPCVLEYLGADMAPASFNIFRKYLKVFFGFCVTEGFLDDDPTRGIRSRKADPRIVDISRETLTQLLDVPDTERFCGLRDRALILLQLDTGIRPNEAVTLLPRDIDLAQDCLTVRSENAKTRKSRLLFFSPATAQALHKLLSVRPKEWGEQVTVFCTETGAFFRSEAWGHRLRKLSERIGKNVSPYDLRHAHALEFLRNGGNVMALKQEMGHSDITTTQIYIHHTEKDIRDAHSLASPVAALLSTRKKVRTI